MIESITATLHIDVFDLKEFDEWFQISKLNFSMIFKKLYQLRMFSPMNILKHPWVCKYHTVTKSMRADEAKCFKPSHKPGLFATVYTIPSLPSLLLKVTFVLKKWGFRNSILCYKGLDVFTGLSKILYESWNVFKEFNKHSEKAFFIFNWWILNFTNISCLAICSTLLVSYFP